MVQAELDHIAMPPDRVAELAGVSRRRVAYWEQTRLVQPSIVYDRRGRPIRLYGHHDLLAAMIVAELQKRGMTLQHVRRIVGYVAGLGYRHPLTEVHYAVHGETVYIQHQDGSWEGDRAPGQCVFPEVLDLKPLRAKIISAASRRPGTQGAVERRRGALGSKEVFAGTRVPVDTVERYLRNGASAEQVLAAYPALTLQDVRVAERRAS